MDSIYHPWQLSSSSLSLGKKSWDYHFFLLIVKLLLINSQNHLFIIVNKMDKKFFKIKKLFVFWSKLNHNNQAQHIDWNQKQK